MALEVIVLAAGAGTRMRSGQPKVLHCLAGQPLLAHVLATAAALRPAKIHVVVGDGAEQVTARFAANERIRWVKQEPRRGTGDAVAQALPAVAPDATVLVLLGDVPLISAATLATCLREARGEIALVSTRLADPAGAGARVLRDRDDGARVVGVVEEQDATPLQAAVAEVNSGMMAAPRALLAELLRAVTPNNAQGEYYLTDVVNLAAARGRPVRAVVAATPMEALGVNDRGQLARLERYWQRRQADALMAEGVTLVDPARLDVRGTVRAGRDCVIDVGVVLEGEVTLGDGVAIGANCVVRDSTLGDDVRVLPMCCIDGARVAAGARIGPFARLRPGTELGEAARVGNFVETKQARLGAGAKANHLAYVGDASVGSRANIGAGAITCNYDGQAKHRTLIGDDAFVGTNATLVAPITISAGAYVAAGSTITTQVAPAELAVGRARQRNIRGWTPPAKRVTPAKRVKG